MNGSVTGKFSLPFRHIGLTGGIATGKSTVAAILQRHGGAILDADAFARKVVEPGQPAYRDISGHFGERVFLPDGALDRKALAAVVFADPGERAKLEAFIHPRVREMARSEVGRLARLPEAERPRFVVEVIPLLYEVGLEGDFDEVWVVGCSEDQQIARLMARDGLGRDLAQARLAAQWPLARKLALADRVIANEGPLPELEQRVAAVLRESGLA